MMSLSFYHIQNCHAKLVLATAIICAAGHSHLTAEELTAVAADDEPIAAKKPDANTSRGERVLLRYQFHPNQFLHYEVVHEMVIELAAKQVVETTKNKSVSRQHLRIVSVDKNGGAVVEPTLDHVRMRSQFDENPPTEFDSDDPNKQPSQFKHVLESIGKSQGSQRVDARGNIVLNDDNSDAMKSATLLVPLPEEPVQVGETWNDDYSVNVKVREKLFRPIKLRRTFTLTQIDGELATIEFKTVELDNPQDPEIRAQLIQMTPAGTVQFNVNHGTIVAKTMRSDKVEFNIAGGRMRAVSDRTEKLFTPKK